MRTYATIIILLLAGPAHAVDTLQVTSPDPLLEDWRWTEFDRRSGIAGEINDIFEDRDGNIWFATKEGAQKYDGLRWTTYTTEDGIPYRGVQKISQTRDGTIWIFSGTGNRGEPAAAATRLVETPDTLPELTTEVFEGWWYIDGFLEAEDGSLWLNLGGQRDNIHDLRRYINGRWETVDQPARTRFDPVQDRNGDIWFGTGPAYESGVLRFDGVRWTQVSLDPGFEEPSQFREVTLDAAGHLWVCHGGNQRNAGVSRFTDGRWEHHPLPSAWIIWHASDGTAWVGGSGTVSRYRNGRWKTYPSTDLQRLTGLTVGRNSSDGSFWLWEWQLPRAFRVDLTSTVTLYDHADSLLIGPEGPGGSMWFHTRTSAVRFEDNQWIEYGPEDGFLDGQVRATARATDGATWAVGFQRGVGAAARFRSNTWEIFTEADGVIDTPMALLPTKDGALWVTGLHEGQSAVTRFDATSGWERFTSVMAGPIGVVQTYEASDGTVWFGAEIDESRGSGLYRYDPRAGETGSPMWMHFDEKSGLTTKDPHSAPLDGSVRCFAEWPTGTLWVGMAFGVYQIDLAALPQQRTFSQVLVHEELGVRVPKFHNLTPANDGIWFHPFYRRDAGAIRHDGQTWQTFGQSDGLPENGLTGLFRTSDGAVWFRGNTSGISRYESRPERPGYGWTRFTSDQVPSHPAPVGGFAAVIPAARVTESRDGSFWLNTNTGVARIRYREVEAPETFLEPAVETVAADGNILLRFSGRTRWDVTAPEDLTYEWRLGDDEWYEASNALVSLTALAPGSHRFEVRAKAPSFRIDPTPAVHSFVVAAQWWRNPVVAGPGILLVIAVLFQSARVVRGKRQLQRSVDALSAANHELFAVNKALQRDRAVERLRAEVQSMNEAEDFERILSLLTTDLREVGLAFQTCEIDVLAEPVQNPTMEHFEKDGFNYTTFRLDPEGNVTSESYRTPAPFPTFALQTIERFIRDEPWQGRSEETSVVEVPAGAYGRLRLGATNRERFTEDEVATLSEFAGAVALGYARYLDIREIQLNTERKSEFLASMSHELRTPMNAIKGFANLLARREPNLTDRGKENLAKVDQASDHLLGMINDLLDLSKIEAGRMDVEATTFNIEELITSACDTVSPLIQEGVELKRNVADDIGEANTDKARLQGVVINLLSNAIKFTDSGSVTVSASQADGQLVVSVSDTGKGIPTEELPTIFDEYRQAEGSESSVQKGTGLGLSITKKFAELLDGTIGVESEVGKGSTFTVRVPAEYRAGEEG